MKERGWLDQDSAPEQLSGILGNNTRSSIILQQNNYRWTFHIVAWYLSLLVQDLGTQGRIPSKVAAELYVGDSLAMIREAGGWPARNPPNLQCAVAATNFYRLANWRGASWPSMWLQLDDLEAKTTWELYAFFFPPQALNSVGQQQHATIWGWDTDPAVLFRRWLRIAVPVFFCWLRITYCKDKRWTSPTHICNTHKYNRCII